MFILKAFFNYLLLIVLLVGGGGILSGYAHGWSTMDMYALVYNFIKFGYWTLEAADWSIANIDERSDEMQAKWDLIANQGCLWFKEAKYIASESGNIVKQKGEYIKVCGTGL